MFIKVIDDQVIYPYTIEDLYSEFPNTSFPSVLEYDSLETYGIFKPAKVFPEVVEWYEDIEFKAPELINDTWQLTYETKTKDIEELKVLRKDDIKTQQANMFKGGWTHEFSVGTHTLDLRNADDKANWTLLLIKTSSMITNGYGEVPVQLRTAGNETITITATEANSVMSLFLAWGEGLLSRKWELDEEVDACETLQDLINIDISEW